jgi:hypothetical protein
MPRFSLYLSELMQMLWPTIEDRRLDVLQAILENRARFENAVWQVTGRDPSTVTTALPPPDLDISQVLATFAALEKAASTAAHINQLSVLQTKAENLGRLRASVYSQPYLADDFKYSLSEMKSWGVPQEALSDLQADTAAALGTDIWAARSALGRIYDEYDGWSDYIDFVVVFQRVLAWGFGVAALATLLWSLHRFMHGDVIYGFMLGGVTGASLSVISQLPPVSTYGRLAASILNIFSRVGAGLVATAIGLGFLSMGIVSITLPLPNGETSLSKIIERCGTGALPLAQVKERALTTTGTPKVMASGESKALAPPEAKRVAVPDSEGRCTTGNIFVLLGLALLLGFSERALPSFEGKLFPSMPSPTAAATSGSPGNLGGRRAGGAGAGGPGGGGAGAGGAGAGGPGGGGTGAGGAGAGGPGGGGTGGGGAGAGGPGGGGTGGGGAGAGGAPGPGGGGAGGAGAGAGGAGASGPRTGGVDVTGTRS